MKVKFETLGCKVNSYETDAMKKLFEDRGYSVTEDVADIYIINTCTVTNLSARKSRQFISRAQKENPDGLVAVVGCYSQTEPEAIEDLGVDIILGTQGRRSIVDLCEEALESKEQISLVEALEKSRSFEELTIEDNFEKTRAYLKIQEGCNQFCTYCIIPYARGPIKSRDFDSVVKEAEKLADRGFKELVLTGIHASSYGRDTNTGLGLIDLIEGVAGVEGVERVRLSSLEPRIITEDFLQRLKDLPEFCDHFHLSLQSGSNNVLKDMNRRYTREEYIEKTDLIRKYFPNAGLTTDIMVGFPGETEADFQDTLDMVKRVNFAKVHVFRYSKRKGTPAASFKYQVDGNVKRDRSERLRELAEASEKAFMEKQIGLSQEVLFEETKEGYLTGHSKNYLKVMVDAPKDLEGSIKSVIIKGIKDGSLLGDL